MTHAARRSALALALLLHAGRGGEAAAEGTQAGVTQAGVTQAEPRAARIARLEVYRLALVAAGNEEAALLALAERALARCTQDERRCAVAEASLELASARAGFASLRRMARALGVPEASVPSAPSRPETPRGDVQATVVRLEAERAALETRMAALQTTLADHAAPETGDARAEAAQAALEAAERAEVADDEYRARRRLDRGRPALRDRAADTVEAAVRARLPSLPAAERTRVEAELAAASADATVEGRLARLLSLVDSLPPPEAHAARGAR